MRKNFTWLVASLICAAYFTPAPPAIFSAEIENIFTHERITLDCNYHFLIEGRDCCGTYRAEGDLSAAEAQSFLSQLEARFASRPSRPVGACEPYEVFRSEAVHWKGEWAQEDRDWYGHTWCSRELERTRQSQMPKFGL